MTVDTKEIVTTIGYMIGVKRIYWSNASAKSITNFCRLCTSIRKLR